MNYETQFTERQMVGREIMLFFVRKPENYQFQAGQYSLLTVPNLGFKDDRGLKRAFSIASSPLEKDLLFVVKTSDSALKRTMSEMHGGTTITIDSPIGNLTLPDDTTTPLVFLAGGVGIAPFRSLILYASVARTGHRITLFYSSQRPEDTPFLAELSDIAQKDQNISVIPTMTRLSDGNGSWTGYTDRINPQMIMEECGEWQSAIYYVVGPPPMAQAMQETLRAMDVGPLRTKMELFTGY
ncbi:MAG TPA: FAD-dependent oxidoreductase [Syntrophorhabdaceae bacterium]|nr:FAD-dependent oxidoreductase [Syntrophorhabdaceae bacterium]